MTDFGNASNITKGTLPTSVLPEIPLEKIPDIPKDKLPSIETSDLPVSGVTADTYAYPSSVTVNAQGMVTAIEEGTPTGANANTDLSNITEAGKAVINHFSTSIGDPIITLSSTLGDNEIWLEGGTVSRTTYAELFAIYGTTYGAGDGSTTFVLPDFRNRAIWGSNSFGYIAAGLPNHSHQATLYGINIQTTWGHGYILINSPQYTVQNIQTTEASTNNPIYKSGSTVQPPSIKVRVKTRYK